MVEGFSTGATSSASKWIYGIGLEYIRRQVLDMERSVGQGELDIETTHPYRHLIEEDLAEESGIDMRIRLPKEYEKPAFLFIRHF